MYTKGLYLNVYTAVYGRQTLLENKERRKMDMEGGPPGDREAIWYTAVFLGKSGGRRMIVVTVELHDVDDVNDLIEMLHTFNERLIA